MKCEIHVKFVELGNDGKKSPISLFSIKACFELYNWDLEANY